MKGGVVIEAAAKADLVAFDKTGTLTLGQPRVTDVVVVGETSRQSLLGLAAGLEAGSSHPLALAILAEAKSAGVLPLPATAHRSMPGQGVEAKVGGEPVAVGSPRWAAGQGALSEQASREAERLEAEGKTVAAVIRSARRSA